MNHGRGGLLFVVAMASLVASGANAQSPGRPSPAVSSGTSAEIVGTWRRVQSCDELAAAFAAAGLLERHPDWAVGGFHPTGPIPTGGDWCADAIGPLRHDHFFTPDGGFGSRDEHGAQVDDGDYTIEGGVLTFPSHATEFGYAPGIRVAYGVSNEVAAFRVLIPDPCEGPCADAYAWAFSAFASGPWQRVDPPVDVSPSPSG